MSDATHNTLVTILLVIAAIIIFVLLGRWFQTGSLYRYSYQPASAIDVYRTQDAYVPTYYGGQSSVTTYSRPSYYYYTDTPSTTQYDSSYYQQNTYSYSCDGMGTCWTNQ